ncbi:MAG TPA: hypothetical protein VET65_04950 [Candidatus Limnocylindrales bacterium]|nr:hypothetical protein [Candidatus Limnocylindrales bacterium]
MDTSLARQPSTEDAPLLARTPWITPRRLIGFVVGWLMLFALLSVFVSNPFQSEPRAGVLPDFAHVMFLHGLLIGMVGLMALITLQVFAIRSWHVRLWIAGGVVAATVLASVGGIWDRTVPGSEVPMWTQVFGFFALDEILLLLVLAMVAEWRRSRAARTLTYLAAGLASASMLIAAVMGHLAGWLMEFGYWPGFLGQVGAWMGFASVNDFAHALVGSHSHEMAVAAMALIVTLLAQQFGYATRPGAAKLAAGVGLAMVAGGTILMTAIYVATAFSQLAIPTIMQSGANGIPGDDVVTGLLVMGGGVVVSLSLLTRRVLRAPVRLAAIWAYVLSFATVALAGYTIELNTSYFGAGDPKAAGAAKDAIFTWMHQDIGLFLLPTVVAIMVAAQLLVRGGRRDLIGWVTTAGVTVSFAGAMVWSFVNPALYGPGYVISTVGVLLVGVALAATLWWGVVARPRTAAMALPPPSLPVKPLELPVVARRREDAIVK